MKLGELDINKVHEMDCIEGMKMLPDKSVDLIISDPPYYKIKGEFDFVFKDFKEWLNLQKNCAKAFKRVLKDNGSLFVYGHAKRIAYQQMIFDKLFNLENNLVWENILDHKQQLKYNNGLRSFAPCTERILFYSCEINQTGLEFIDKEYIAPRNPFSIELKKARIEKGVSINKVAEYGKFYGNVNHGGAVTNWERGYNVPLKNQWEILCNYLPIERQEYEDLRQEYEDLRQEYEDLRRPFNNVYNLSDVIKGVGESNDQEKHPTIKPEKLTRSLILTTSKKESIVLVPFVGSGTECAMSIKENRNFIGFEIEPKYCEIANKRINAERNQLKIFT